MSKESKWTCVYEGCDRGPKPENGGYQLERVSPKGGPFEGACLDHYKAVVLREEEAA